MKLIIINEKHSRLIILETAKGKTGRALTSSLREDARGKDTTSDKVKRWAEIVAKRHLPFILLHLLLRNTKI